MSNKKKSAEVLLKDSEEKLRSIFSAAPLGIGLVVNRVIREVNNTLCEMTGYRRRDLIGRSSEILYPDKEEFDYVGKEKYEQIAKYGMGSVETRFKCKNGKILNVVLNSTPLDNNDYSKGVTFTVLDITYRYETESALRKSQSLYQDLVETAQDLIWQCDDGGRYTYLNPAWEEVFGYKLSEMLGKRFADFQSADWAERDLKEFTRLLEGNIVSGLETVHLDKDGKEIFLIFNAKNVQDENGNVIGTRGTAFNVTEQRNVLKKLTESELLYIKMVENSPMGMHFYELTQDGKLIFIDANPAADSLLGTDNSKYVGKTIQEAFPQLAQTEVPEHYVRAAEDGVVWSTNQIYYQDDVISGAFEVKAYQTSMNRMVAVFSDITERTRTEDALKMSEEKFRSIAENLTDVVFITDKEGKITYISPSVKIFGYASDECIGRFFSDFIVESELEKAMGFFTNALNSINITSSISLLFRRKDGTVFFAELSGSDFTIAKETKGVLGLLRDVSDKMNREIELRKLSSAVEQSQASIVITDSLGNIEYVNSQLCELTGYSKDELIGENPRIMSSGETSKDEYGSLWKAIIAGKVWKGEFHNKKKNGDLYWESAVISPIKNEKGDITHYLGIKEDITEKRKMEAALIASEQRYRELFLNNPVPTYIFDEDSLAFLEVNDAAVYSYGYSREEFISMTLKDIRTPEDIPALLESISSLDDKVFHSTIMRHRKKDGTLFPVEITSHALPEKNGIKTRLVMSMDITERLLAVNQMKLAKEKAEASDKLKTMFLNNISHEVRTPLNGIMGFAELISQPGFSEEEKLDSLQMLSESSDRLLETITNYMDISLITSGSISINKKPFNIAGVFKNIYNKFNPQCESRQLKLILDLPENSDTIKFHSDPEVFQKIISHLLGNAIKFTEKGSVQFGYSVKNGQLEVFVIDTGIGIGDESKKEIFSRFVKEDRGPSRMSEGSGIGLSIVKGMTEFLGGEIDLESKLEIGTTFRILWPFPDSAYSSESGSLDKGYRNKLIRSSVLVAEDDDVSFLYLDTLLRREVDVNVLHAKNGKEAIRLFKENPEIKLVLMDIKMPELSGIEATIAIKAIKKEIPIIAITAYAMSGDEERIIEAGCNAYLSKPITKASLLEKIAMFFEL